MNACLNRQHTQGTNLTLTKASGHKGYGLSLMVEMLCGVMAGASVGPAVSHVSEGVSFVFSLEKRAFT